MKVASPTATRVHQRLGTSPLLPRSTGCSVVLYGAPVLNSCTEHLYFVLIRRTGHGDRMTCTTYSCQVMATTPAPGTAPADTQRPRLSKAAVVARAIALADAEGLDALTIRRLAQELGVTPMALYWHFRNKEELLTGLADQFWSEIDTDVDEAAPWPAQLRAMLESLVQVLRTHPSASQLLIAGEKQSPAALEATEVTLEVLRRGGFDPRHASAIARNAL